MSFLLAHLMWFLVAKSHKNHKFSIWEHIKSLRGKQLTAFFFLHNSGNVQDCCCTSFLIVIFLWKSKEKLQWVVVSQINISSVHKCVRAVRVLHSMRSFCCHSSSQRLCNYDVSDTTDEVGPLLPRMYFALIYWASVSLSLSLFKYQTASEPFQAQIHRCLFN